jgi:hypothetical protein
MKFFCLHIEVMMCKTHVIIVVHINDADTKKKQMLLLF